MSNRSQKAAKKGVAKSKTGPAENGEMTKPGTAAGEELKAELRKLAEQVGPQVFYEMGIKMGLELEPHLRANNPDHPMLRMIDEWRARQGDDPNEDSR